MAYDPQINWKNEPDHTTPINADNLNTMDKQIWKLADVCDSQNEQLDNIENLKNPSKSFTAVNVSGYSFPYTFLQGENYVISFYNTNAGAKINANLRDNRTSGSTDQLVKTGINVGERVSFIPNQNYNFLYVYANTANSIITVEHQLSINNQIKRNESSIQNDSVFYANFEKIGSYDFEFDFVDGEYYMIEPADYSYSGNMNIAVYDQLENPTVVQRIATNKKINKRIFVKAQGNGKILHFYMATANVKLMIKRIRFVEDIDFNKNDFIPGNYSRGAWVSDSKRIALNYLIPDARKGNVLMMNSADFYILYTIWQDGATTATSDSGWRRGDKPYVLPASGNLMITIGNGSDYNQSTAIIPSDLNTEIILIKYPGAVNNEEAENEEFYNNEIEDTLEKVISASEEKALVFAIVTDSHNLYQNFDNWTPTIKNLKILNEKYKLDFIAHLGDIVEGEKAKADSETILRNVVSDLLSINSVVFTLTGNHDDNHVYYNRNQDGLINDSERYALLNRYNDVDVHRVGTRQYFYYDFETMNIRIICLDGLLGDGYPTGNNGTAWGYTPGQIAWVRDVALNTDKQVLFLSHVPLSSIYSSAYELGYEIVNSDALLAVIQSFINNNGVVIGFFNGHTHMDFMEENSIGIYEIQTANQNIKVASTPSGQRSYNDGAYTPFVPARQRDTVTQELWDVVVIKPISKEVNIIRFGAGNDRNFSY